ncbi:hypothetical protein M404DRAFT_470547 [Pisolithus tinctorius Marx 270]|uniref:Uncharacterized protein n=1 Tax=Pisolithus tinctorius Marx 270 TaxID=870435 RepID=A0A0C3PYG7_PISTI|nr:hypothetical protein M404DRAFT_470547 [Pisolithus tinctorius Marx 270]
MYCIYSSFVPRIAPTFRRPNHHSHITRRRPSMFSLVQGHSVSRTPVSSVTNQPKCCVIIYHLYGSRIPVVADYRYNPFTK